MNAILDFICMVLAELLVKEGKHKNQNEIMYLRRESNQ